VGWSVLILFYSELRGLVGVDFVLFGLAVELGVDCIVYIQTKDRPCNEPMLACVDSLLFVCGDKKMKRVRNSSI
jgi:hypothetical protein